MLLEKIIDDREVNKPKNNFEISYIFEKNEDKICYKESNTIVCGSMHYFDHDTFDVDYTVEPFFGDIDLFGF